MTSEKRLIYIIVAMLVVMYVAITIDFSSKKEKEMFPVIIGDAILKSNETGINSVMKIVSYDGFQGDIINGYNANYTSSNGTMIIFMAKMSSNESAYRSLKDMVIRMGYNESSYNDSLLYNDSRYNQSISSNNSLLYNDSRYNQSISSNNSLLYNESRYNQSISSNNTNKSAIDENVSVVRLPIKNPELFLIQKEKNKIWHYAFSKEDKVYWIGFNNLDIQYHLDMMIEVYKNVDRKDDGEYE